MIGGSCWRTLSPLLCSSRNIGEQEFYKFYIETVEIGKPSERSIVTNRGWKWVGESTKKSGWCHPNKVWVQHIANPRTSYNKVNGRWGQIGTPGDWRAYWKTLWRGWAIPKTCMLLWRIIQHEFNHNTRAKVWKVSDGTCPRCGLHQEMIEHLFFLCSISRNRWIEMKCLTHGTAMEEAFQGTLFAMVAKTIQQNKR